MLSSLALAFVFAAPISGDVFTVGLDPQADFASVQAAVDVAKDGDEIRIAAGTYNGDVTISAKSLSVVGESGVILAGAVTVSNLTATQEVVLRSLEAATPSGDAPGILVEACEGLVFVEGCAFSGWVSSGLLLRDSEFLVVNESTLASTYGYSGLWTDSDSVTFASYESTATGGLGQSQCDGWLGGSGLSLGNSQTLGNRLIARGGRGGNAGCCPGWGGWGGIGVNVHSNAAAVFSGINVAGGPGGYGCDGGLVTYGNFHGGVGDRSRVEAGSFAEVLDPGARLMTQSRLAPGEQLSISAERVALDDVWVIVSDTPDAQFNLLPGTIGATLVAFQGAAFTGPEWQFLGVTAPGSATLLADVTIPAGAISANGRTYIQTVHVESGTGDLYYGPLRVVDIREPELGTPFCFGDGGDQMGCQECPCGNEVAQGLRVGCSNGTGRGCRLFARGSRSVTSGRLRFDIEGANPNTAAVLFSANNKLPLAGLCPPGSGIPAPTQDGLRCIGGDRRRHGVRATNSSFKNNVAWGEPNPAAGIAGAAGFTAGQTRNFQVSYREDPLLVCGQAIQLSNAVEITFAP